MNVGIISIAANKEVINLHGCSFPLTVRHLFNWAQ